MTLKRLAILLAILIFLAGVGIAWLWQYAYTPQGRARVIIAQLKGDNDTTLRGWMLKHLVPHDCTKTGFHAHTQGLATKGKSLNHRGHRVARREPCREEIWIRSIAVAE